MEVQTNTGLTWSHQDSGPQRLFQAVLIEGGASPLTPVLTSVGMGTAPWQEGFLCWRDLCAGGKSSKTDSAGPASCQHSQPLWEHVPGPALEMQSHTA